MTVKKTSLDKSILRKKALLARASLSQKQREIAAKKASANFIKYILLKKTQIIAAYYPIKNEINCLDLVEILREQNHKICLPVVIKKELSMVFRLWEKDTLLKPDLTKTPAPDENAKQVNPTIIILPLVAFDKNGNRLGYGKGYYDKTIANMKKKPLLVGYGFNVQEVGNIEAENHDIPLDYMVSEKNVRKF